MENQWPPPGRLRKGRTLTKGAAGGGSGQVRPVSLVSEVSDFLSLTTLFARGLFEREHRSFRRGL